MKRLMAPSTRRTVGRAAGVAFLAALLAIPSFVAPVSSFAAPSRSELEAARAKLDAYMEQESAVAEQLDQSSTKLEEIQEHMATTELEVGKLQKRIGSKVDAADSLAAELYKGGSTVTIEAVLAAKDLDDIETRLEYLRSSQDAQTEVFERLAVAKKELDEKLAELEKDRVAAAAEEQHFADLKGQIESQIASQRDEVQDLTAQIAAWEERQAEQAAAAAAASSASSSVQAAPAVPVVTSNVDPNSSAGVAVNTALAQVGKPYQWGAAGPSSFDCSGLTMYAWAHAGVSLPHSSAAQYSATTRVSTSSLAPGDLLFYYSPIHHVAMYIGGGRMVEAPYTGASVRVVPLRTSDLVGAGRPGV